MAAPNLTRTANRHGNSANSWQVSIWIFILTNLLIVQVNFRRNPREKYLRTFDSSDYSSTVTTPIGSSILIGYPLVPNEGKAVALPSIRINQMEERNNPKRDGYGGQGDKKHLGGFTDIDFSGISPATWKFMITFFGIKSVMDVGCGRGISSAWFFFHGVDTLCLEGSHDAVLKTVLPHPAKQIVEHDFSRGPWWPTDTYDAVWCVEFLEHVGRNYHHNYFAAFRKSALIFATHSKWGGWHHVEVHDDDWWINKFRMYGFIYSEGWTNATRTVALSEKFQSTAPNGELYNAQHVWLNIQVFINPAVAALPQHAHLLAEPGCYHSRKDKKILNRACDGSKESKPPPEFDPLVLTPQQDKDWTDLVKKNIVIKNARD